LPLQARPGSRRRRAAGRSGGGPSRDRSVRSARGASSAGDVAPDCAEPRHPGLGESTARRAFPPDRSSSSGGRAAVSSARFRDGRWPRSLPGAEASAAWAWRRRPTRRSGGEPLASLGPTTSEHATTALGRHSSHEAVLPLAGALLGLIGPLHGCVPFLVQRSRDGPSNTRTAGVSPACARIRMAHLALGRILPMPLDRVKHTGRSAGDRPAKWPRHGGSLRFVALPFRPLL
jgi:hypothetical protein